MAARSGEGRRGEGREGKGMRLKNGRARMRGEPRRCLEPEAAGFLADAERSEGEDTDKMETMKWSETQR